MRARPALAATALLATVIAQDPVRLDLAADAARQVVVDREGGQYLGHVSTVLLDDGCTILAVYPKGHGKGAIVMKRSGDGGRSWGDRLPMPSSWASSQEVPTIWRTEDADGHRRLVLWSGLHPARRACSDDDGATWSELEPAGDWGGIVVMGDVVRTPTAGRYLAFFHDDGRFLHAGGKAAGTFTLLQTETSDGGRSWRAPRAIWSGTDLHLCEPGAVRSPTGDELLLLLRENARNQTSQWIATRDDGATWSSPRPLHPALTGDRHTARYAADGRLVIVFRDMGLAADNPTHGDFVAWVGRYADLARGHGGQYHVRLLDNQHGWDCGYPGLERLPDGTFVATTYGHWDTDAPPYVVSVRFTLAELDALASRACATPSDPAAGPRTGQRPPGDAELAAALATLRAYSPTRSAPTDAAVLTAERTLVAAIGRLSRGEDPVGRELLVEWQQRGATLLPSRQRQVYARDPLARVLVRFDDERTLTAPIDRLRPHATAAGFPGPVPAAARPAQKTREIDLAVPGRHSLGLYAAPAALVTLSFDVEAAQLPAHLYVRIGAHSDDLARCEAWPRMPRISRVFPVDEPAIAVANAYGGLLYVEVPPSGRGRLGVTIDGAVPAPLFVLGETRPAEWAQLRQDPGPWAELATSKVVLTVPSERIRGLAEPTELLQFWDRILDGAADLAAQPRQRQRPERYVADVEIAISAWRGRYPITTHLEAVADMVSLERLRRGPWGLFHGLGHNHQQPEWTFAGTDEVTANLFPLYLCETLCGLPWNEAWDGNLARAEQRLREHVQAREPPWGDDDASADVALRLTMYSQVQRAFGWEGFMHAFAEYRDLPASERPRSEQDKRDQWLVRLSRAVDRDLGPFFAAWGIGVTPAARTAVADLQPWLPGDWPSR